MLKFSAVLFIAILTIQSCTHRQGNADKPTVTADSIKTPAPAAQHTEDPGMAFKVEHYWDGFNAHDTVKVLNPDFGEQAFANFIALLPKVPLKNAARGIDNMVKNADAEKVTLNWMAELGNKYLYDGNSPFHNDVYYEVFLNSILSAKTLDKTLKPRWESLLGLVQRNQPGRKATDFSYVRTDAHKTNLYSANKRFIILFFYEPGCKSCEAAIPRFAGSAVINKAIASKALEFIAIYPDGNEGIWKNYAGHLPGNWVNGIDREKKILMSRAYDLKTSPTVYLLDKQKMVLLKDTELGAVENTLSNSL